MTIPVAVGDGGAGGRTLRPEKAGSLRLATPAPAAAPLAPDQLFPANEFP